MSDTRMGCLGCILVLLCALLAWVMVVGAILAVIYAVKA